LTTLVAWYRIPESEVERELLGLTKPSLDGIQACLDDTLCSLFPGKLPEDFDTIDYGRLMQMLHVRSIKSAELARERWMNGKLSHKDISAEQWDLISKNDKVYNEWQLAKKH